MKKLALNTRWTLGLLLAALALGLTACASTDEGENASARPWNAPQGWETGLPSGMTDGRYGR